MKNSHFTPIILAKSHQNINFNNSLENHSTQTELNTKSNVPKKAALETKYISFMSKWASEWNGEIRPCIGNMQLTLNMSGVYLCAWDGRK